ncbi:MAG: hypothetical protein MUE97_05570, partial [Phycisphaerales bacterium]|nr:hypothetical protein [Phycisphaerales bacterium]
MTATRVSTGVTACVVGVLALAGGAMQGCQPTREITRVEPDRVVDVDYRFNDTDARAVYQAMVEDAL